MLPGLSLVAVLAWAPPPPPPPRARIEPAGIATADDAAVPDEASRRYLRRKRGFAAGIGVSCALVVAGLGMILGNLVVETDYYGPLFAGIGLAPAALVPLTTFSILYVRNERRAPRAQVRLGGGGFSLHF